MTEMTIELIADEEIGGFTARVPDIPAYGEGETEEAAVADLMEALKGYVETFGVDDARSRISHPKLRQVQIDLTELSRA